MGLDNTRPPVLWKFWLALHFRDDLPEICPPFHVTGNLSFQADICLGIQGMIYDGTDVCPPTMGVKLWDKFIPDMDHLKALLFDEYQGSPVGGLH